MVVLVQLISPIFKGQEMRLIGYPEISRVKNLLPWTWDQ